MNTFKLFIKLLILFVVAYVVVDLLTKAYISTTYQNIENYEIQVQYPKIQIKEAKATYMNGNIQGTITNNTGESIDKMYIKVNVYSKRNIDLGTEFIKIENLKENETRDFELSYRIKGGKSFKINVVKEAYINEEEGTTMFRNFSPAALLGASMILVYCFL